MKRQQISVKTHSDSQPAAVYALLRDGATWPTWSPIGAFELEQPGPDGAEAAALPTAGAGAGACDGDQRGEGIGAIRVFRTGRTTSREEIVELQTNRRFGYTLLHGLPIRDYRANVDLEPATDGGTDIHWHSSFTAKVPGTGWLWRRMLGRFIKQCAQGLATHATTSSATR